jgi:3-oxo-5-alpha-steroid 4-dehydrogenase 1
MSFFNSIYTLPDFTSNMDTGFFALGASSCLLGIFANNDSLNLPFLSRSGGLLAYSKFAEDVKLGLSVPSKLGMTLLYLPSTLLAAYCYSAGHCVNQRSEICAALMGFHFGKRTLECLFLHKYSGKMPFMTSITVTSFYSAFTFSTCLFGGKSEFPLDFNDSYTIAGLALCAIGQAGNFYHHYLLANLRKPGEKEYKVPKGGLFTYIAAPHYLFELVSWLGASLVARHLNSFMVFASMSCYLFERADAQHLWNRMKLKDKYPMDRLRILPFIW